MAGIYDDDGNPVMPFGKHKDELLSAVPSDYLWWVLDGRSGTKASLGADAIDRYPGLAEAVELELEERDDE